MNPTISTAEAGETYYRPDAATLTKLALAAHLDECSTCRNEFCPTAQHLEAAARPDATWVRDYGTGA